MQGNYQNYYRIARRTAGMTQERWSEAIGVSVESVKQYESGAIRPSDDVVMMMCQISGLAQLGYWHLTNKSAVAAEILPPIEDCSLPQAVIQLICQIRSFGDKHCTDNLMEIAADGKIDDIERPEFEQIISELDNIVRAAMQLKYSKESRS